MRSGWLQKAGRVLLVLGLAVGPWPSAFAAVPMHAGASTQHQPVAADEPGTAHCPGHEQPADAVVSHDCCDGDGATCGMLACASASCASVHAVSLPPAPAPAGVGVTAAGADDSTWVSPSLLAPLAGEPLRPPIA